MADRRDHLRARQKGQSLAEFALVLPPLVAILLGIIQLGFIFNAYVTVANAAREGARAGSVWVADQTASQLSNDGARTAYVQAVVNGSLGLLDPANATTTVTPIIDGSACRGTAGDTRRKDQCVRVHVEYCLPLIIPLIDTLLGSPQCGIIDHRLAIPAESQMVIN
jgi:Flp pilus assembly protein TadG